MLVHVKVCEFACMGVIGLYVLERREKKSKKIGSLFSNCPRVNQLNLPTRSSFSRGNFLVFPAALVSLQSDGHGEGKVGFDAARSTSRRTSATATARRWSCVEQSWT